jgi:hypothetical protein
MSHKHRSSIPEKEEPMDTPDPHRMTRRKKFDAFEQGITGGHHIGHLPVYVHEIEGWTFRRCRCGFSLALTASGAIWWLRTTKEAMEINSFKSLLRALRSDCWAHPRPKPPQNAVIAAPAIAEIAAEPPNPPASDTAISAAAISTASRRTSLETQSEPQAKSNEVPAPMPRVEKPPPAKQRRTYVPNNTAHNACAAKSTWSMTIS